MSPLSPIGGFGPLSRSMATAASGMRAQATRLRVTSENLANVSSAAATPGGTPYRRKVISFAQAVDRATGAGLVQVSRISGDQTPFRRVYDPSHPAADAQGYVQMPNVSDVVELADSREAQRSYEANLAMLTQARTLFSKTLDILKA